MINSQRVIPFNAKNLYIVVNKKNDSNPRYLIVYKRIECYNSKRRNVGFTTIDDVSINYNESRLLGKVMPVEYSGYMFVSRSRLDMFLDSICKSSPELAEKLDKYQGVNSLLKEDVLDIKDILNNSQGRRRKEVNTSIRKVKRCRRIL